MNTTVPNELRFVWFSDSLESYFDFLSHLKAWKESSGYEIQLWGSSETLPDKEKYRFSEVEKTFKANDIQFYRIEDHPELLLQSKILVQIKKGRWHLAANLAKFSISYEYPGIVLDIGIKTKPDTPLPKDIQTPEGFQFYYTLTPFEENSCDYEDAWYDCDLTNAYAVFAVSEAKLPLLKDISGRLESNLDLIESSSEKHKVDEFYNVFRLKQLANYWFAEVVTGCILKEPLLCLKGENKHESYFFPHLNALDIKQASTAVAHIENPGHREFAHLVLGLLASTSELASSTTLNRMRCVLEQNGQQFSLGMKEEIEKKIRANAEKSRKQLPELLALIEKHNISLWPEETLSLQAQMQNSTPADAETSIIAASVDTVATVNNFFTPPKSPTESGTNLLNPENLEDEGTSCWSSCCPSF